MIIAGRPERIPSASVAADYNEAQGLDVRLSWPEDITGDGDVRTQPPGRTVSATPSEPNGGPQREAEIARAADASAPWLPVLDARLSELVARLGRLEENGPARTSLIESRLAELLDRVAGLERIIEDRLDHLDDRLEYLAGAGMMPAPPNGDEGRVESRLMQVAEQLDVLAKEVSALRRRIPLRARSEPASGPPSGEELATAVATQVVAALGVPTKPQAPAASTTSGPEVPEGRRRRR